MKAICFRIAAGLLLMFAVAARCHALSPIEWSHLYIFTNHSTDDAIRVSTEAASKERRFLSQEFFDALAEIVLQRQNDPQLSAEAKRDLWLLLYAADQPRYADVLKQTGLAINDYKIRLTLQDGQKFFRQAERDKVMQYQPGATSFTELKAAYLHNLEQTKAITDFSSLHAGQNAGQVIALAGRPQAVDAEYTGGFFSQRSQLIWIYRNLGAVLLQKDSSGGADDKAPELTWHLVETVSDAGSFAYTMPNADTDGVTQEQHIAILHNEGLALRKLLEFWNDNDITPSIELMDIAAERLVQVYRLNHEGEERKASVLIIKLLMKKGEHRYAKILEQIKLNARDPKLRRAVNRDSAILTYDAAQYQAGQIDLAALKTKYPLAETKFAN